METKPRPGGRTDTALCREAMDWLYNPDDGWEQHEYAVSALPAEWMPALASLRARGDVTVSEADGRLWVRLLPEGIDRLRGRRR